MFLPTFMTMPFHDDLLFLARVLFELMSEMLVYFAQCFFSGSPRWYI